MINKPVAWIYQHPDTLQPALKFAEPTTYWATVISTPDIPLYTHPAELTDEEIAQAWAETKGDMLHRLMPFAKAILRKAQEK